MKTQERDELLRQLDHKQRVINELARELLDATVGSATAGQIGIVVGIAERRVGREES